MADVTKLRILRWKRFSLVIKVSPKCSHMCPDIREAKGDSTKEEKVIWLERQRFE